MSEARKLRQNPDHVQDAAKAHTDLNVFYAVIAIMEGGLLSSDSYGDAHRIVTICKSAGGKALARFDKARARAQGEG